MFGGYTLNSRVLFHRSGFQSTTFKSRNILEENECIKMPKARATANATMAKYAFFYAAAAVLLLYALDNQTNHSYYMIRQTKICYFTINPMEFHATNNARS